MHHHSHHDLTALLQSWDVDHVVIWLLPLIALVYTRGFWRAHRQMPRRYPLWRFVSFLGGLAVVFLAIASPLHAFGEVLLYLHMAQHMLLTMLAPPLIWLGQPVIPLLRGLPPRAAKRTVGPLLTSPSWRRVGRRMTHPTVCWVALAIAIVAWHLPRFYELVLQSEAWHQVQHGCFFTAALLFWWPIVQVWPSHAVWPRWTMIPYLIGADLINTAQSAILSFSSHVLYPSYARASGLTGLSPLDDQALAGVIMWVPGSIAFLLPAIILTVRLFEPGANRTGPHAASHAFHCTPPERTSEMAVLTDRVRCEFLETPGLRLTLSEAARFWGLDRSTCQDVLQKLVDAGFLRRAMDDTYVHDSGR